VPPRTRAGHVRGTVERRGARNGGGPRRPAAGDVTTTCRRITSRATTSA
jgi:hypothetical protein